MLAGESYLARSERESVNLFSLTLWRPIHEYGLTSTDPYSTSLMSAGILVVAWLLVAPALFVEARAAGSASLRWFARGSACIATAVLAWFGTLPVGLRFFGSRDPVSHADVRSAVMNSLVLLVGDLLMLLLGCSLSRMCADGSARETASRREINSVNTPDHAAVRP